MLKNSDWRRSCNRTAESLEMLTFRRILFPVDFSARCGDAAPYVALIARGSASEVVLLHAFGIYEGIPCGAESPTAVYWAYENGVRQRRIAELESFGHEDFKDLSVTRTIEVGEPAERIVQYVAGHAVDLVVMPTHGHGKFRQLLLGSVTSKVLHDAACPVLTTAHSENLASKSFEQISVIVCAVDLSSDTSRVVRAACDMALASGAAVQLVHAIPSPERENGYVENAPFQRFLFDTASEQLAATQRETQTHFDVCIRHGNVAAVVAEAATNCGAQLVVIGRGRIQKLLGRLRTNVAGIIRESPCPVLSV
jgi:nucleotide-binding universal stress UspA family protein